MSIKFSKPSRNNNARLKSDSDRSEKVKPKSDSTRSSNIKFNGKSTRSKGIKIKSDSNLFKKAKTDSAPASPKEIKSKINSNRSSNIKFDGKSTRSKGIKLQSDPNRSKKGKKFKKWMLIPIIIVLVIVVAAAIIIIGGSKNTNNGGEILSVSLSSLPTKLVYYVGEQPSYSGLGITTTLNNGTTFTEGPEACTFSGFNSEFAVEEQQITVTYGEHTFVYTVEIKERPRPFSPLARISLESLPKTEYKVGDWMNVNDGVLLLEYEDGSTRRIRLEHKYVYDFSTDTPGSFTITVKYRENGILKTCTYEITVTE